MTTLKGANYAVNLVMKPCDCREFNMLKIPCTHAKAAACHVGLSTDTLVHDPSHTKHWRGAYREMVYPVPSWTGITVPSPFGEGVLCMKPPGTRRPLGRPRKQRIPSKGKFKVYFMVYYI